MLSGVPGQTSERHSLAGGLSLLDAFGPGLNAFGPGLNGYASGEDDGGYGMGSWFSSATGIHNDVFGSTFGNFLNDVEAGRYQRQLWTGAIALGTLATIAFAPFLPGPLALIGEGATGSAGSLDLAVVASAPADTLLALGVGGSTTAAATAAATNLRTVQNIIHPPSTTTAPTTSPSSTTTAPSTPDWGAIGKANAANFTAINQLRAQLGLPNLSQDDVASQAVANGGDPNAAYNAILKAEYDKDVAALKAQGRTPSAAFASVGGWKTLGAIALGVLATYAIGDMLLNPKEARA